MLEFKKRVLELNLYGEEIKINYPTVKKYQEFLGAIKKGKKEELDLTVDFLVSLGLDKNKVEEMEPSHFHVILEELTAVGKK